MKKKKVITAILGIVFFTAGVLIFIHLNNDHAECETIVEYAEGAQGEKITIEKHICKERFHF